MHKAIKHWYFTIRFSEKCKKEKREIQRKKKQKKKIKKRLHVSIIKLNKKYKIKKITVESPYS